MVCCSGYFQQSTFKSLFNLVAQMQLEILALVDFLHNCINCLLQLRFSLQPEFLHGFVLPKQLSNKVKIFDSVVFFHSCAF